MNYWLDLFSGTGRAQEPLGTNFGTLAQNISGLRERTRPYARRVRAGDVFLCYLTGVMQ
jgi:hypothetical protein